MVSFSLAICSIATENIRGGLEIKYFINEMSDALRDVIIHVDRVLRAKFEDHRVGKRFVKTP